LYLRGLLRARSRFPETVGNSKNAEQRMEGLEGVNALAKQVLSQTELRAITCTLHPIRYLQRFPDRL
jgi:hypothetical protein